MSRQDVLSALPRMSEEQLREVQARAQALLGKSKEVAASRSSAVPVLDAVADHLKARGFPAPPIGAIKRLTYYRAAVEGAEVVDRFVRERLQPPTRTHEVHLHRTLVKMLARWLEEVSVPVGHKTLCQNLHRIPAVVDRQFPGYSGAGLLSWILRPSPRV